MGEAKRRHAAGHIPGHIEDPSEPGPSLWLWTFLFVAVVLASIWLSPARAHSFYPWECCSSQDCWPMGADADAREPDPVETPAGWRLADGIVVPFALTRKSPDGRFHVCRRGGAADGAVIQPSERPICLWAPVPTF